MSALSPRQMYLLDQACWPLREAFGGVYLVGTAQTASKGNGGRSGYRDVDVRMIINDEMYDGLQVRQWTALSLLIGCHMAEATGLPIDFQIQRQTEANALHHGPRNPLGLRSLENFTGDAHGRQEIAAKIERSSLGTPHAQALRASVSDEQAARVVARAAEIAADMEGKDLA